MAIAVPASKWGWLLFLGSNLSWLVFSQRGRYRKMFVQTTVFTASSLLAITNSFWPGDPMQVFITGHAEHPFLLVLPIVFVGLTGARARTAAH